MSDKENNNNAEQFINEVKNHSELYEQQESFDKLNHNFQKPSLSDNSSLAGQERPNPSYVEDLKEYYKESIKNPIESADIKISNSKNKS